MPNNAIAAVIVLAAMTPGLAFHLTYARFVKRDKRSTTLEIVELFSVGAATTIIAFLITAGLGEFVPFLVDPAALDTPLKDFQAGPWRWFASCMLVLVLSVAVSMCAGWLIGSRSDDRLGRGVREGDGSVAAMTERGPGGLRPYLAVELVDGRLLEGLVLYVSPRQDGVEREIVLQHPIGFSGPGDRARAASEARRIIVPERMVQLIHISYPHLKRKPGEPAAPVTLDEPVVPVSAPVEGKRRVWLKRTAKRASRR